MFHAIESHSNKIGVLRLDGVWKTASDYQHVHRAIEQAWSIGHQALILDLAKVSVLSHEAVFALVELTTLHGHRPIAITGLSHSSLTRVRQSGLDRHLPIFADMEAALSSTSFSSSPLSELPAIILLAGSGRRASALSDVAPVALFDILGKPMLQRQLEALADAGIQEVHVNPGHLGQHVIDTLRGPGRAENPRIFVHGEGRRIAGNWKAEVWGTASTLSRLHHRDVAWTGDLLVVFGNTWLDLDIQAFWERHREVGADISVAVYKASADLKASSTPLKIDPQGRIISLTSDERFGHSGESMNCAGAYIINVRALELLEDRPGLDLIDDLLPAVQMAGGHIQGFDIGAKPFWIGAAGRYMSFLQAIIEGFVPGLTPMGEPVKPGCWVERTAQVSNQATLSGPIWIGAGATVAADTTVTGPAILGADCVVGAGAVVRNSLLWPGTALTGSIWADGLIVHPEWTVDHALPPGSAASGPPLPGVMATEAFKRAKQVETIPRSVQKRA